MYTSRELQYKRSDDYDQKSYEDEDQEEKRWILCNWFGGILLLLLLLAILGVCAATLGIVNTNKSSWKGADLSEDDIQKQLHVVFDKLDWIKKDLHHLDEELWDLKEELQPHSSDSHDPPKPDKRPGWPIWGHDIFNSKNVGNDAKKKRENPTLKKQWSFHYEGEVGASATVTVQGDIVYSTAYSGQVVAVDRRNGQQLWVRYGNDLLGLPPFNPNDTCSPLITSRNAPAIFTNAWGQEGIIISLPGDRQASPCSGGQLPTYTGPVFTIALDRFTGEIMWKTEVHPHPWAVGTSSGSVYKHQFFAGVSSLENGFNLLAGYPCCNFTGRMYSININTGALIWSTPTLPDIEGYAGAGVTGSSPAVFPEAGLVFFGSGNGYSVPDYVSQCQLNNNYPDKASLACLEDGVYIDSTLALDIVTGNIRWAYRAQGVDVWTVPCLLGPGNPLCPNPPGPDYDLLQSPILVPPRAKGSHSHDNDDSEYESWNKKQRLLDYRVVSHYKSGIQFTFRAVDGKLICSRATGSAGTLGGGQWGSATDSDKRLFVVQDTGAPAEPNQEAYLLPNGAEACDGAFWAIDIDTCEVQWVAQVAYSRPSEECGPLNPFEPYDVYTNPATTGLPNNKTADGKPQKSISETGKTAETCPERMGANAPTHLENADFANAHGALAIADGVVYGATMTGNLYGLRLWDGACLTQAHCPYGGIYGGISIVEDQLFVNCGYGRLLPTWVVLPGCSEANPELCGAGCPEGQCELMALHIM